MTGNVYIYIYMEPKGQIICEWKRRMNDQDF